MQLDEINQAEYSIDISKINFDEDGYLILKSYSSDPTYAFKDDVLTLAIGGPNNKIPLFDMMSDAEKATQGVTYII